jgi:isoquinoline 1-oxidoreductase subunit beta
MRCCSCAASCRANSRSPSANASVAGEISIKNGRVQQSNFDSYQILRLNEAAVVEVFAATGKRLRKMPIDAVT